MAPAPCVETRVFVPKALLVALLLRKGVLLAVMALVVAGVVYLLAFR